MGPNFSESFESVKITCMCWSKNNNKFEQKQVLKKTRPDSGFLVRHGLSNIALERRKEYIF